MEMTIQSQVKLSALLEGPKPPGPIAILCHGFLSKKECSTYETLTPLLNEKGIATLRFDFFGHGKSEGDFADITTTKAVQNIIDAIRVAKEKGYTDSMLVGSSFGGGAAILAAAQNNTKIKRLALKCPVSNWKTLTLPISSTEKEWEKQGYTYYILNKASGIRTKLNWSFWQDARAIDIFKTAENITCPVCVVHGTADTAVPIEQSKTLTKKLNNKTQAELIAIDGADHQFTEHFDEMIEALFTFLTK